MQQSGQDHQEDFFDNTGGLNLSDTVFKVQNGQSVDGFNYILSTAGGILKRQAPSVINSSADTALKSVGFGLYNPATGTKSVIRFADSKVQLFDTTTPAFTNLSQDTAAATTTFFTTSTQVVSNQFNNANAASLWFAGGGATNIFGAYSTTKVTKNGVAAPTGSFTATRSALGSGTFATIGTYFYAVVLRKRSTQALSNAALDVSATVVATTDKVTINLSGLTGIDTTLYDRVYIYRSSVGGVTAFTTGDLVTTVDIATTTYDDTGTASLLTQNIPRAGSQTLDNSQLSDGTYNVIDTWKRKMVTASGSTLYFSDVNKPESWPTVNQITIPSGGPITALATVAFISPQANALDELLVVFKERELWVITGDTANNGTSGDWVLKFIDATGCPSQALICYGNGYIGWLDYRGVYLWNGTGKPYYMSKPLEPLFSTDGDLDKTLLSFGCGTFFRRENSIIWYLSHKLYGTQKYALRLDMRLTMPSITQDLTGNMVNGVFTQDKYAMPVYSTMAYLPSSNSDEFQVIGDASGKCYFADRAYSDGGSDYSFTYKTRPLDMGNPNTKKLFKQVIVWVKELGTWNLTLDYWTGYKSTTAYQSTQALPISSQPSQTQSLYDVAYYDVSNYDDYSPNLTPIIYNLQSGASNSTQGTALQLQFRQETQSNPIEIHGFSVIYNEMERIS